MKRTILLITAALAMNACADNKQIISFSALPDQAQTFVRTYFNPADVTLVMMEKDLLNTEYDLQLQDGTEINFNADGSLDKAEAKTQALPDGIVPADVAAYVRTMFPNAAMMEYESGSRKQTVGLNNGLELEFDQDGRFIRMDD